MPGMYMITYVKLKRARGGYLITFFGFFHDTITLDILLI